MIMFRHELNYIRFTKKEMTNNLINKIIKLNHKCILKNMYNTFVIRESTFKCFLISQLNGSDLK